MSGQVIFERDDCRPLLAALAERPLSWDELCAALPGDTPASLSFWLDLLLAAAHVGPFLPAADVAAIDRQRLRRINRQRLQQAASCRRSLCPNGDAAAGGRDRQLP